MRRTHVIHPSHGLPVPGGAHDVTCENDLGCQQCPRPVPPRQRPPGIQFLPDPVALSEQVRDIREPHRDGHRVRAAGGASPFCEAAVQHVPLVAGQLDIDKVTLIRHDHIIAPQPNPAEQATTYTDRRK